MNKIIFLLTICFTLYSCIDEYDIDINGNDDYYVIDAMITDKDSTHFVFIKRSNENATFDYLAWTISKSTKTEAIDNVTVSITDDCGNIYHFDDCTTLPFDTIFSKDYDDDYIVDYKGYYQKTSNENFNAGQCFVLKHKYFEPCHSYTLNVSIGDRKFTSTQYMNPLPNITKIGERYYTSTTDGGTNAAPIFSFIDSQPDIDNYYLVRQEEAMWFDIRISSAIHFLNLSIFNDINLPDTINNLHIPIGIGADSDDCYWKDIWDFELFTISKDNYEYYDAMDKQLSSDGGIYQPTPATPTTNIDGYHVQGQFIAASKIFYRYIHYKKEWEVSDRRE